MWHAGFSCSAACGVFLDQRSNPCLLHWEVNSYPLYYQEDHIYPFIFGEHLACFHFWALVNIAVEIFGIKVPVQFPFSSSIYLGVELLDELVRVL